MTGDLSFMTSLEEGPCRIVEDRNLNNIKIKLRDSQIPFISSAIEKFLAKCPMRFSTPEIVKGWLRIDPHDFMELLNYIDVNFENKLEIQRLRKMFRDSIPSHIRNSDSLFQNI
jgi:hypothetical protein